MNVEQLLSIIRNDPRCETFPPTTVPSVGVAHRLPDDLRGLYEAYGGIHLFNTGQYPLRIVGPEELLPINEVVYSGAEEILHAARADRSSSWYIVADSGNGSYTTIDLDPARLGLCYDSAFDGHGVAGSCPIVATSFTEFLERAYRNGGDYWYWLKDEFQSVGDAYDEAGA